MSNIRKTCRLVLLILAACFMAGCSTIPKIAYLRGVQPEVPITLQKTKELTLKPGDRLQITVYSSDEELVTQFNLRDHSRNYGGSAQSYNHPYTVDENGEIEMPVLGRITVGGRTRLEVADHIKYRLLAAQMVDDPTVLVDYYDMGFYALGEIGHTGRIAIPRDEITILEAISLAGDLTISGRRDNVLVFRTEKGVQTPYMVDLTDPASVYNSPVYYLQQNDIIYVEPTVMRANQSTQMANSTRNPTFWVSTVTSAITFYLFIRSFITGNKSTD